VVRVAGEIDLTNVGVLAAAFAAALADRPAHLVVDVAELRFCCARGVSLLIGDTGPVATASDVSYALSGLPAFLERSCRIVGGGVIPVCYPGAAAAIDGIRRSG
jgi:hypothetical protein